MTFPIEDRLRNSEELLNQLKTRLTYGAMFTGVVLTPPEAYDYGHALNDILTEREIDRAERERMERENGK